MSLCYYAKEISVDVAFRLCLALTDYEMDSVVEQNGRWQLGTKLHIFCRSCVPRSPLSIQSLVHLCTLTKRMSCSCGTIQYIGDTGMSPVARKIKLSRKESERRRRF